MRCPRCEGLMLMQKFCDLEDDTGQIHFFGLHCLICGEIVDPTILINRMAMGSVLVH